MSTLAELYAVVREQTQTTSEEIPNSTLNPWFRQAFERTIAGRNDWPFYQKQWNVIQVPGQTTIALPGDAQGLGIVSLRDPDGMRLNMINQETAEDVYFTAGVTSSKPFEYSVWGNEITLWPRTSYDVAQTYTMRGYRRPVQWSSLTASDAPDCDERLHMAFAQYATALAYIQQEDETLELDYMTRWQRDVEIAVQAIMEPAHHRPVTMGPHYRATQPGQPFVVVTPGGP